MEQTFGLLNLSNIDKKRPDIMLRLLRRFETRNDLAHNYEGERHPCVSVGANPQALSSSNSSFVTYTITVPSQPCMPDCK